MVTYNLISNYNATMADVQYPFVWTLVSVIITFFAAMVPYVMVVKTTCALLRMMSSYKRRQFVIDFAVHMVFLLLMIAYYATSISGFFSIMNNFRPGGATTTLYGLAVGQEMFWFLCATLTMGYFCVLSIYRCVRFATSSKQALSYHENVATETKVAPADIALGESDSEAAVMEKRQRPFAKRMVDYISGNTSILWRVFATITFVYAVFIFFTVYPYSIQGSVFTTGNFGVSSVMTMVLGIFIASSLIITHMKGSNSPQKQMTEYISNMINNEEVIVHTHANSFYGFDIGGHMISMKVHWLFVIACFFFFTLIVYEVSCSFDKAFTSSASVFFVAFLLSVLSGHTGSFIPFFMAALFWYSNSLFMTFYVNPPTAYSVNSSSSLTVSSNYVYILTAANCSSAAIANDQETMFALSISGFVVGCIEVLRASMRRK